MVCRPKSLRVRFVGKKACSDVKDYQEECIAEYFFQVPGSETFEPLNPHVIIGHREDEMQRNNMPYSNFWNGNTMLNNFL